MSAADATPPGRATDTGAPTVAPPDPAGGSPRSGWSATSSDSLLRRAKEGSAGALSSLVRRHLPPLRRWAHGRMPPWMRRVADTGDLVQNALLQTLRRFPAFEPRGHKALAAYLRQAVLNQIRDEHRRLQRRGDPVALDEGIVSPDSSPFDEASFSETRERYIAALRKLKESDQELVVAHVELGYTHEQLGFMTGRTTNAARVALTRALQRLTEHMLDG